MLTEHEMNASGKLMRNIDAMRESIAKWEVDGKTSSENASVGKRIRKRKIEEPFYCYR